MCWAKITESIWSYSEKNEKYCNAITKARALLSVSEATLVATCAQHKTARGRNQSVVCILKEAIYCHAFNV